MSWRCVQWAPPHCHVPANGFAFGSVERGYPAVQERDRSVENESCRRRWRRPEMCPLRPHLVRPTPMCPRRRRSPYRRRRGRPRSGQRHGPGRVRAAGLGPVSCACVHVVPSQSQVSPRSTFAAARPPKRTHFVAFGSNAICRSLRASGPVSSTCVQLAPSHSQVSPRSRPVPDARRRREPSVTDSRRRPARVPTARPGQCPRPGPVRTVPLPRVTERDTRKRRATEEHNSAASTVVREAQPRPAAAAQRPVSASRERAARMRIIDLRHPQGNHSTE